MDGAAASKKKKKKKKKAAPAPAPVVEDAKGPATAEEKELAKIALIAKVSAAKDKKAAQRKKENGAMCFCVRACVRVRVHVASVHTGYVHVYHFTDALSSWLF